MRFLTFFRSFIRWINLMPIWQWVRVRVWGNSFRATTFDRWLCLLLHRVGMMGRADRIFLRKHLQPGMTVVDIGANQGLYTLLFSRCVGSAGRTLAFEPDDMLYRALEENVHHNKASNVRTFHCALGSERGTMILYRSLLNSGDNRLASGRHGSGPREEIQIHVDTLDGILAGERIDFIKMDVQGWEMNVLRGMEYLLDDPRCEELSIYFEYWPQGLMDAGGGAIEPLLFLAKKRFSLFQPVGSDLEAITDIMRFASSVRKGTYLNLYATRRRQEPIPC